MKVTVSTKIKVTRKHIMDGIAGDSSRCAIALAIGEMCPGEGLDVDDSSIVVGDASWANSREGSKFVTAFDATGTEPDQEEDPKLHAEWMRARRRLKPFTLVLKKTVGACGLLKADL